MKKKSEQQLNNTIYLMEVISNAYMKKHRLNVPKFFKLDNKVHLFKFISDNAWYFDELVSKDEMLRKAEEYVNAKL